MTQQEETLKALETSVATLRKNIAQLNQRKADVSVELKLLKEKIEKFPPNSDVQTLLSVLRTLKDIEKQESELESHYATERLKLEDRCNELERILQYRDDEDGQADVLDHCLSESNERLIQAKRELGAKLRAILTLKRQIDDIPSHGELIQYERRLSELYSLIQGKLRQTRNYYATFNALSEIKDLMLKETSLLNSISSQFQDAISSPSGRVQLINSMEGISQGSQQKLKKVELGLQAEQKAFETLKEKYAAARSEQRLCYSLLKDFQAECARNEQLRRGQASQADS